MYHPTTSQESQRRSALAPQIHEAFTAFSAAVFADGALPEQTKQLIAVAVAHVTQCPYCIQGHTALALRSGNTQEQIMEAICGGRDARRRRLRAFEPGRRAHAHVREVAEEHATTPVCR